MSARFVVFLAVLAACSGSKAGPRQPVAEEPLVLSPARDAGPDEAAASSQERPRERGLGPSGPTEVSQGTATPCPGGRSVPFGFDLVPDKKLRADMRQGVPVLETVRFAISNLVGVPRNIEILEADQLGASGALKPDWEAAQPMVIKQAYFEGGSFGPPGLVLVLPAHAVTTVIIELQPARFYLPKRGIRVHVRVDGRRACFEQALQVGQASPFGGASN